jgi:hypothetical protein
MIGGAYVVGLALTPRHSLGAVAVNGTDRAPTIARRLGSSF